MPFAPTPQVSRQATPGLSGDSSCHSQQRDRDAVEWPVVHDGDLFGVALEPSGEVLDVWFAIGSEWVAAAELDVAANRTVAEATFDGAGVALGEQVFLVAIRTDEVLETYGYRVTYEE